eukprot:1187722-Prorocentrum_minimum.AAC.2
MIDLDGPQVAIRGERKLSLVRSPAHGEELSRAGELPREHLLYRGHVVRGREVARVQRQQERDACENERRRVGQAAQRVEPGGGWGYMARVAGARSISDTRATLFDARTRQVASKGGSRGGLEGV